MFADYKTFNLIFWFIKSSWFTIHCPLTINLAISNGMQILQNGPWHLKIVGMVFAFTLDYAQLLEIQTWQLFPDLIKQFRYHSFTKVKYIFISFHFIYLCVLKLIWNQLKVISEFIKVSMQHWSCIVIFYISITSSMFANNNKVVIYSSC